MIGYKVCCSVRSRSNPEETAFVSLGEPYHTYRLGEETRPFPYWGPLVVCTTQECAERLALVSVRRIAVLRCRYQPSARKQLWRLTCYGKMTSGLGPEEATAELVIPEEVVSVHHEHIPADEFRWATHDGVRHASLDDMLKHIARCRILSSPMRFGYHLSGLRKVDEVDFPIYFPKEAGMPPGVRWADYLADLGVTV